MVSWGYVRLCIFWVNAFSDNYSLHGFVIWIVPSWGSIPPHIASFGPLLKIFFLFHVECMCSLLFLCLSRFFWFFHIFFSPVCSYSRPLLSCSSVFVLLYSTSDSLYFLSPWPFNFNPRPRLTPSCLPCLFCYYSWTRDFLLELSFRRLFHASFW